MVFFQFVQLHLLAAAVPLSFYPPTWLDSLLAASPSLLRYNHVMKIIRTIGRSSPPFSLSLSLFLPYPIHLSACFSSSSLSSLPSLIEMIRSKHGNHSRIHGSFLSKRKKKKKKKKKKSCCDNDDETTVESVSVFR